VQGLGSNSEGYVLADLSMQGTPKEWARVAVDAAFARAALAIAARP
jgi:phage terminase large subunit-like protein